MKKTSKLGPKVMRLKKHKNTGKSSTEDSPVVTSEIVKANVLSTLEKEAGRNWNCIHQSLPCFFYSNKCAIKAIIGNVIAVLIKNIINNFPRLTGILEPKITPPTSDR